MSEGAAGTSSGYGRLIEEVFIDPIRSVVVVDDEFPTLDTLLDKELGNAERSWAAANARRVQEIIRFCCDGTRRWMVEIHDGPPATTLATEGDAASHLHQSDLMILDFHLDVKRPNDGGDAIGILRRLADNDHFNLVVVYTKGYGETGGDIPRVVREIALGLCSPDERLIMAGRGLDAAEESLEEWEDHDAGITKRVREVIDDGLYLRARISAPGDIDWKKICSWPEFQDLEALLREAPSTVRAKVKLKSLIKWAFHRQQQDLTPKLATCDYGPVDSKLDAASETNWIRTDRCFITVVGKSSEPASLPDKLLAALRSWNPEPHRLLMSKMRAELDERGVVAEGEVLGNRCLHAGWLEEYLTEDPDQRTWKIQNTIYRHWEGLGDAIRGEVTGFAERLAEHLSLEGRDVAIEHWYPSLPRNEIDSHLNRYASSKPNVEGGHLTTGHVLQLQGTRGSGRYWLCLSPACDLVPGQKKESGWPGRLGDHTPFIAVELFDVSREAALSHASGGNHLFLEIEGALKCFSFTPPPRSKGDAEGARTPNPKWEQMFAAKQGRFGGNERTLSLTRASEGVGGLRFDTTEARVVAQLRYEYALNLLQRLGANLSRVGVDFVGMTTASPSDGQVHA